MPTEAEFEAFSKKHRGENYGIRFCCELMKEMWPSDEELLAYISWEVDQCKKEEIEWMTPISQSEFIDLVSTMNFTNDDDVSKLMSDMWKPQTPCVPVGIDCTNTAYRLVPDAFHGIRPDRRLSSAEAKGTILSDEILGVNTNVQPREPEQSFWRSKLGLPEMSCEPNESDWKGGGFVFHQLGELQHWVGKLEDMHNSDPDDRRWYPSKFFVAVRFNSNGISEGIYIFYNFYPTFFDGEQAETKIIGDLWGYLPCPDYEGEKRFTMAKIADNIKELGFERKLNLSEVYEYPVEIVQAMRTPAGTIVRTTVARD